MEEFSKITGMFLSIFDDVKEMIVVKFIIT